MKTKVVGIIVLVAIFIVVIKIYRQQKRTADLLDSLMIEAKGSHQMFADLLKQNNFKLTPFSDDTSDVEGDNKEHYWGWRGGRRFWRHRPWRRWGWYANPYFYTDYPNGYYIY